MNTFYRRVIDLKVWVSVFMAIILLLLVLSFDKIKQGALADITNIQVVVITKTGAYSTDQIEKVITYPIENTLASLPSVEEVRSLSKFGLSLVTVIFKEGSDVYFARQLVNEKLQAIQGDLPSNITPTLAPVSTGLGEVFMYVLEYQGDKTKKNVTEQLQYLKNFQEYRIAPYLKQVPGVAEVDTNGGYTTEIHINLNPNEMRNYGINYYDILNVIKGAGAFYGGGYIQKNLNQVTLRSYSPVSTLTDLERYVVKVLPTGESVYLNQVSDVQFGHSGRVGSATYKGEETVLGTVLMRTGEDSRKVAEQAAIKLAELKVPSDIKINPVYNRQSLVEKAMLTVRNNLFEGALFVIVVLFIILGHFRSAFIVSLAIPLSMIFTLLGMSIFNIPANLMSLGAIDFGLLVDGSVVMMENYLRRLSLTQGNLTFKQRVELVISSCAEVSSPVIYGIIIIVLVYIPLFGLSGVEGKMFNPMAKTVIMALLASLFVAMVMIPLLMLYFINPSAHTGEHKESYLFRFFHKIYVRILEIALKNKSTTIALAAAVMFTCLYLFNHMGSNFVPQLDEKDLVIGVVGDSKLGIDESTRVQRLIEKEILKFEEVETVFSRLGTPESATDPMGPNFADTFVILKKNKEQWPLISGSIRSKDELFQSISEKIKSLEGVGDLEISSTQPIEMRFNEILEGSRADVTFRILGPDLDQLMLHAQKAYEIISKIKGVESIEYDALTGLTKSKVIDFVISQAKAAQYGLTIEEVNDQIEALMAGREVGLSFQGEQKIPIKLKLNALTREDSDIYRNLPIALSQGGNISLGEISEIVETEKVTTIARTYGRRYSAISIYLDGRDIASFVKEAQQKINEELKVNSEYDFEWGGQFKNLDRAKKTLTIIIPLTLLMIFVLITNMSGSFAQSLVIFSAIPFGTAGGVALLYLRNINFSVSAAVGFIALSGIVVLNSLVLVSFINAKIKEGMSPKMAILQGSISRLRPVLMTALVAGLGFIPMAFNTGLGAEVQRPLATVVIGGLLTATPATLILIPVILSFVLLRKSNTQII